MNKELNAQVGGEFAGAPWLGFTNRPLPGNTEDQPDQPEGHGASPHMSESRTSTRPSPSATAIQPFGVCRICNRLQFCACGENNQSAHPLQNPQGSGSTPQPLTEVVKSSGAASESTRSREPWPWLVRLLVLGVAAYGPVLPMWYLSTTPLPAPIWLLLATQGLLTMSVCLLAWTYFGTAMTPNAESSDGDGRKL